MIKKWTVLIAVVLVSAGCHTDSTSALGPRPPLFEGMGPHRRKVTTASPEAQRYFDQGLNWSYAFNHDEAIRSFEEAARLDPTCAMAWWGVALCNGPHINNAAMDEAHSIAAWAALGKAEALKDGALPVERALIDALRSRYANPAAAPLALTPAERAPFDRRYADAMKQVLAQYAGDRDAGTLYAEALMDLRPWDFWDAQGQPRPETPEILAVLEKVLADQPDHPGANHLYIHAVEAGPHPAKAVPAADRLRTLVPASGHLVHMPGHIDVRVGQWRQAQEQNREAVKIDAAYRRISPRQGFYNIYMAHNHQFLSWACMHTGKKAECLAAARAMMEGIPPGFIEESPAAIDGYLHFEIEAQLRFGEWDAVLKQEEPPAALPIKRAFWRYGRATALAAKKDVAGAEREQAAFRSAVSVVPEAATMAINNARTVLDIAEHSLVGEIAYRKGAVDHAVAHLKNAVEIEDTLKYMEPPDWVWPVRHQLGAVLVSAGRVEEAEAVYRADLARWPENGWSLWGLAECLRAKGMPEHAAVLARFNQVWAGADVQLSSTCLCIATND